MKNRIEIEEEIKKMPESIPLFIGHLKPNFQTQLYQEIDDLQSETDTLIQERQNYETLLGFLQSPVFLEKEARSSLGYAKPGETVVVIEKNAECRTPHQNKFGAGPVQNDTCMEEDFSLKKMSNPRKWWIYFFGKI